MRASVHVSIDVPDLEAGIAFYGAVFGFTEKARPFPQMAIVDANNVTVCMHAKPAGTKSSPNGPARHYDRHWTPVHLDQGPMPAAFCSDPFGNGFCVIGERP